MRRPIVSAHSGLRFVVLSAYLPWHGHGGGVLVGNLLRQLSQRHEVTLLTYVEPGEEKHLPEVTALCQHLETVVWQRERPDSNLDQSTNPAKQATPTGLRRAWRGLPEPLRASACAARQLPRQWQSHGREPLPSEMAVRQTAAFAAAAARCLSERAYDVVMAEWPEMALYGLQGPVGPLRVLDTIELRSVTYQRYWRASTNLNRKVFWFAQWRKMKRLEAHIVQQYDVVTAVSQQDGAQLASMGGKAEIVVNPVGLDLTGRQQHDTAPRDDDTLVFLGRLSYRPNADAVRYFMQIFPVIRAAVPHARFLVVGGEPPPDIQALNGNDGVTVTGYVPDLTAYLATGAVFVLPMRYGGGIKIKALEAMAAGIPIVATPAGAEGLDGVVDGRDLLIARSPAEFAAKTITMLQDSGLRRGVADHARRLVWQNYDSAANVTQLERLYIERLHERRSQSRATSEALISG